MNASNITPGTRFISNGRVFIARSIVRTSSQMIFTDNKGASVVRYHNDEVEVI